MYIGRKYTATRTAPFELEYACTRCGYRCDALVIGVGQGVGNSPYMLDDSGAQQRAHVAAEKDARSNAELVLGLAACKRCRQRPGLARFWIVNVLGAAGIVLGSWLIAALLSGRRSSATPYVIFGIMGLVCVVVLWVTRSKHLTTADARVHFGERRDGGAEPVRRAKKSA